MKIHIIGGSGSGKSYLARALSKKLNIPHYELDDLLWDNSANTYGIKRKPEERDKLLQDIISKDNWITEGVCYDWISQCFENSDIIYLIEISRYIYRFRIIKRFIKRKIGIEKSKKETLKSVRDLLKWTKKFDKVNLVEIKKILENYTEKVVIIRSRKDINKIIQQ